MHKTAPALIRILNSLWVVYQQDRQWCWFIKNTGPPLQRCWYAECGDEAELSTNYPLICSCCQEPRQWAIFVQPPNLLQARYLPSTGVNTSLPLGVSPCVVFYCAMLTCCVCCVTCHAVCCVLFYCAMLCVLRNDDIVDDCDDYWQGRQAPLLATAPHN